MRPLTYGIFAEPSHIRRRLVEVCEDGEDGRPIALRGFNLSASAKNTGLPFAARDPGGIVGRAAGFLPVLAADGFDLLRVPVVWEFLQPHLDCDLDPGIAAAIRALVAYAGELGFRVIVDIHQDVLGSFFRKAGDAAMHGDGLPAWLIEMAYGSDDGRPLRPEWKDTVYGLGLGPRHWALNYAYNPTVRRAMTGLSRAEPLKAFRAFAARLARLLAGMPNVVAYEVLNEPLSECIDAAGHLALARAVREGLGDGVRDGTTPTLSVMPAGDWLLQLPIAHVLPRIETGRAAILRRSSLPAEALQTHLGPGYWLMTPHFYDPRAAGPWGDPEPHRYEAAVSAAESLMGLWHAVPVVGEFGCGADKARRDECNRAWIDAFERRCWSWCLWNFNPDAGPGGNDRWCHERYSVAEALGDGAVGRTPAYGALLRPFPRRYGGPLLDVNWDGTRYVARVGRAFVRGWRTEIHVPRSLGRFGASGGIVIDRTVTVDTDRGDRDVVIALDGF